MLNSIINGLLCAIANFGKWWKRSSSTVKVIAIAVVVSIVAVLLGFLFNDSSSQVSGKQYLQQFAASTQGKTKVTNKPQPNKDSETNNAGSANRTRQKRKSSRTHIKSSATKSDYWMKPTGGAYPNLSGISASQIQVQVNLAKQRVHIIANGKTVYTMIVSSGIDDSTPRGDYKIGMRGAHFFNDQEGVGADYWVGFIDGLYLFHSVPTGYKFGSYIPSEGAKLGRPASHGCVRLSVADAKWFYANIPDGTSVHIG